jgi:hypothetical protein
MVTGDPALLEHWHVSWASAALGDASRAHSARHRVEEPDLAVATLECMPVPRLTHRFTSFLTSVNIPLTRGYSNVPAGP